MTMKTGYEYATGPDSVPPSSWTFAPLDAPLGAVVHGIDMRTPPGHDGVESLSDALERYGVLILPGQELSPEQQVGFCSAFGRLDVPPRFEDRRTHAPEVFVIGNPDKTTVQFAPDPGADEPADGELEWHADHSQYLEPTWISMMYGAEIPPVGGDTLFVCSYSAYEALPPEIRSRWDDITLLHSVRGVNDYLRSLGKADVISAAELELEQEPPQRWPLVRTHPRSGRKALYFGSWMSIGAVGMDDASARTLLRQVTEHATQERFQYRHRWTAGDVVLWDNRRVVHAATPFDSTRYRRVIHRITVRDDLDIR